MTEFTEPYKRLTDDELLTIVANASSYTSIALETAKQELLSRNISADHLAALEAQNALETAEKEALLQKQKEEKNWLQNKLIPFFSAANPFLKGLEIYERYIRIMSWIFTLISMSIIGTLVLTLIYYFDLIIIYSNHISEIDGWKGYILLYSVLLILTILGTILFWKRKTLGWVLMTFYIVSIAIGPVFELILNLLKPSHEFDRIVDNFMMGNHNFFSISTLYIVFFAFSLYVLFKRKVRTAFKVKKPVAYLVVLLVVIFQILALYPITKSGFLRMIVPYDN